ncbi:MAG TPA: ferrous iron transport protein A [Eubacteriaceae bacterium]|nr:ferrous iron transport protein A [Eubacteriaceae bacterium]
MLLSKVQVGHRGQIAKIQVSDKKKHLLNSIGCHIGEEVTLISKLAGNYVINIKDSRYAIDEKMAKQIELAEAN